MLGTYYGRDLLLAFSGHVVNVFTSLGFAPRPQPHVLFKEAKVFNRRSRRGSCPGA
jgi:hypothetical protein